MKRVKTTLMLMPACQLKTLSAVERRLLKNGVDNLKQRVTAILDRVPQKKVLPEWDQL